MLVQFQPRRPRANHSKLRFIFGFAKYYVPFGMLSLSPNFTYLDRILKFGGPKSICYNFHMIDPDLQKQLQAINTNLEQIKNKKSGIWRAFFNGIFSALGYVVGLAIVIVILAWVLNKMGLLPQFQKQVSDFQTFMTNAEKLVNVGSNDQQGSKQQGSIITLPDGRKVQIVQ